MKMEDELKHNLAVCEGIVKGLLEDRTMAWDKITKARTYAKELLACQSPVRQGIGHLLMEILSSKQSKTGEEE